MESSNKLELITSIITYMESRHLCTLTLFTQCNFKYGMDYNDMPKSKSKEDTDARLFTLMSIELEQDKCKRILEAYDIDEHTIDYILTIDAYSFIKDNNKKGFNILKKLYNTKLKKCIKAAMSDTNDIVSEAAIKKYDAIIIEYSKLLREYMQPELLKVMALLDQGVEMAPNNNVFVN